ncbi:MAG: hypothetical protein ACRDIL_12080 [Candidatus Limnocylindrales bacterium]
MIRAAQERLVEWDEAHGSRDYAASLALEDTLIKVGALDHERGRPRWDLTDRARFDARDRCLEIDAWLDDNGSVPDFLAPAVYRIGVDE